MNDLAKLQWQCRRGSKELDLLLINYLENHYPLASEAEKAQFAALLNLEDTELLAQILTARVLSN